MFGGYLERRSERRAKKEILKAQRAAELEQLKSEVRYKIGCGLRIFAVVTGIAALGIAVSQINDPQFTQYQGYDSYSPNYPPQTSGQQEKPTPTPVPTVQTELADDDECTDPFDKRYSIGDIIEVTTRRLDDGSTRVKKYECLGDGVWREVGGGYIIGPNQWEKENKIFDTRYVQVDPTSSSPLDLDGYLALVPLKQRPTRREYLETVGWPPQSPYL